MRSGEAGRGFAAVASEVKAPAEQTAKATGEIGQQIGSIQAATQESVRAICEISGTIEKLSEISSAIAAAVEGQGAATQEISRNIQQASIGTRQVSSNIAEVRAAPARPARRRPRCCRRRRSGDDEIRAWPESRALYSCADGFPSSGRADTRGSTATIVNACFNCHGELSLRHVKSPSACCGGTPTP